MTGALAFLQAGFVPYQIQINTTGKKDANRDSARARGQPSPLCSPTARCFMQTQHSPLISTFCTATQKN